MESEPELGICKLCCRSAELQDSHIIPQFVFDYMKTTGTGFLRNANNPNDRKQDGAKEKLLCRGCEQRFGNGETWFASRIFYPFLRAEQQSFGYNDSLYYFAVSVLWRCMLIVFQDPANTDQNPYREEAMRVQELWRAFLNGESFDGAMPDIHMVISGLHFGDRALPVQGFNLYLMRSPDCTLAYGEDLCFTYAKFSRFLFFGMITPYDPSTMQGTLINPKGGVITTEQTLGGGVIGEFLANRAAHQYESRKLKMSDRQRQIVKGAMRNKLDRIMEGDLGAALLADRFMPVDPSILWCEATTEGRCPCGSGQSYGECHGGGPTGPETGS